MQKSLTQVNNKSQALSHLLIVAESNAGYHYSSEAEADSIGEPELKECVEYHGKQAKIWDEVCKSLKSLIEAEAK